MTEQKATNVTWHEHAVSTEDRCQLNGHKGAVLWFTGLKSGSPAKAPIANAVDHKLSRKRANTAFVLDGDNIRMGLNKNLGFSPEDRTENIRRIGEVAKLFASAGTITTTAFISPYRKTAIKSARSSMTVSSSKSTSKLHWKLAKLAIPKACTRKLVPERSKVSPESMLLTKNLKKRNLSSIPTAKMSKPWHKKSSTISKPMASFQCKF